MRNIADIVFSNASQLQFSSMSVSTASRIFGAYVTELELGLPFFEDFDILDVATHFGNND